MNQMELEGMEPELQLELPKTPAADFVERFRNCYQAATSQPFHCRKVDFIIAARMIKKYGLPAVLVKAHILAQMCYRRSVWFTRKGWGDFTIENLSNKWNMILDQINETDGDRRKREFYEMMKKREQTHA